MVPLALASRFPEQWQREKWHLCRGRRLGEEFGVRISTLTTSPSRLPHPSPLFLLGSRPRVSPTLITPQQLGFGRSAWTLDSPVTRRGVGGERSRGGITKARGAARGRGFPRGRESLGCGGDGGDRRSGRTMSMGSGKAGQHPHGVGSIFPKGGGQRQLGLQARRAATRRAPRAPPKANSASRVQGQRPRRRPAWCADSQPPFLAPSRSFSRTKSCNVPGVFPPILAAALRSRPRIPRGCAQRCPGPARGVGLRPSPSPPPGWTQVAAVSPASPRVVCAVEGPAWRRTDLGLSRP